MAEKRLLRRGPLRKGVRSLWFPRYFSLHFPQPGSILLADDGHFRPHQQKGQRFPPIPYSQNRSRKGKLREETATPLLHLSPLPWGAAASPVPDPPQPPPRPSPSGSLAPYQLPLSSGIEVSADLPQNDGCIPFKPLPSCDQRERGLSCD